MLLHVRPRPLALAACAIVLGGCSSIVDLALGDDDVIETDRASYVAASVAPEGGRPLYAFTVITRLTNRSDRPVRLGRCHPDAPHPMHGILLVDADDDGEGSAFSPAWACAAGGSFVVQPGATRVDTLRIQGPTATDGRTGRVIGRLEGRMRLTYGAWRSNVFEVSVP
jgi:hypothetical protein